MLAPAWVTSLGSHSPEGPRSSAPHARETSRLRLEQLSELTGLGDRARPPVGGIWLHGQGTVGHEINLVGHQPAFKKHNKNQCVAYSEGKYKKNEP